MIENQMLQAERAKYKHKISNVPARAERVKKIANQMFENKDKYFKIYRIKNFSIIPANFYHYPCKISVFSIFPVKSSIPISLLISVHIPNTC